MEVFETSYLPLWLLTSLHGYKTSLLGTKHPFWVVNSLWVVLPFLGVGLVHPKRLVTTHREEFPSKYGGQQLQKPL